MDASLMETGSVNNHDFEFDDCRPATEDETGRWLLDEENSPLTTNWMVYDRQFPDGQREICVTRSARLMQNGPLPMPNRAKRGESEKRTQNDEDSAKRAKQNVRHRCKAISADRMITLTYRENMQDMDRLKRDWDAFRRRMGKCKQFHYVAAIEPQERGAFHMHIAVHGRQSYEVVRHIWQSIVGKDEAGNQMAQINVRNPHDFYKFRSRNAKKDNRELRHLIGAYISKYITEDQQLHELNKKRYWTSRGIVVPEKIYYQLPYGTTEFEAYCHVMDIACAHNNNEMVFFSNSALGCCWIATGSTQ
jgi:hypothetical protein